MAEYVQDEEDIQEVPVNPPPTVEEEAETENQDTLYKDGVPNLQLQINRLKDITKSMKEMSAQIRRMKDEYNK